MVETGRRLTKIATLELRELSEGEPVELWMSETGMVVVRAYNECGNNYTDVGLLGLLEWSRGYGNRYLEGTAVPAL
jgi:hypothetical protein